jgi:hypothetical protein
MTNSFGSEKFDFGPNRGNKKDFKKFLNLDPFAMLLMVGHFV